MLKGNIITIVILTFIALSLFGLPKLNAQSKTTSTEKKIAKPNFIIIMSDDLGYGALSCYGHKDIKTPNIDQMVKQGVKFIDYHSNGTVCSPTRAALMTGRYQQRTGVNDVLTAKSHRDEGLPLSEKTIAEAFKEAGYTTGIFGKWHLGYDKKFNPVRQGFDEFKGFLSGNVDYHSHIDQEGFEDWYQLDTLKDEVGYSTNLITKNSIDFITRHKDQPFLLYISHEAPHGPFQSLHSRPLRSVNNVVPENEKPNENTLPVFKEMIEIMDSDIGKTMQALRDLKLDSNTVVVFCSDNGGVAKMNSNGMLRGAKGNLWEGGHRVPAIALWPGHIKPNTVSDEVVLSMDMFPTFLEIAGMAIPKAIDGISIAQHVIAQKPLPERTVFWGYGKGIAARKGKWKLILPNPEATPALYDQENDLAETKNVAEQYPEIVTTLMKELNAWKADVFKEKQIQKVN